MRETLNSHSASLTKLSKVMVDANSTKLRRDIENLCALLKTLQANKVQRSVTDLEVNNKNLQITFPRAVIN